MAGNARGKLKEQFEGIHRNFEWIKAHIEKSLNIIAGQLALTEDMVAVEGDAEKEEQVLMKHPLYNGLVEMTKGIETMDEITQSLYATI